MNWNLLDKLNQLDAIDLESENQQVIIFKHSTRCSISAVALSRFERNWQMPAEPMKLYFLDLLQHRDISDAIASRYQVQHESPQVLVIQKGACIFNANHSEIDAEELMNLKVV